MTSTDLPVDTPSYVTVGENFVGLAKFEHGTLGPVDVPSPQRISLGSRCDDAETVTDLAGFARGFRTLTTVGNELRALRADDDGMPAAKAFNFCLGLIRTSLSGDLADEILRLCPELPEDGSATLGMVLLSFSQLSSWSAGIGRTIDAHFAAQAAHLNQG